MYCLPITFHNLKTDDAPIEGALIRKVILPSLSLFYSHTHSYFNDNVYYCSNTRERKNDVRKTMSFYENDEVKFIDDERSRGDGRIG